jgi:23S rRNA pseudouridine1911/1915/1917 synthase
MDNLITVNIDEKLNNKTVREILFDYLDLSNALVKKLKQTDDGIMLNGVKVYVTRVLKTGDKLVVNIRDKRSENIVPEEISLDILYEDEDIIVINKKRGMPTHPSHNHHNDTLANGLMNYFKDKEFTFRAITRLDKDTSGVVLVAKNLISAQLLGKAIREKKIFKEYVAVINGIINPMKGEMNFPIKRREEGIILRCVAPDGKDSLTEYSTLKTFGDLSLVKLIPVTGRTHQLRVHLSHIGHPIYGDDLYNAPQKDESLKLHCRKITFNHPTSDKLISIEAPIPDDIETLVN